MRESENGLKVGGIVQYIETLDFTEQTLKDRVDLYLTQAPEHLYHCDIVSNDTRNNTRENGYYFYNNKHEKVYYCEVIATRVLEKGLNVNRDECCRYSKGKRLDRRSSVEFKRLKHNMPAMKEYYDGKGVKRREERMCHCLFNEEEIDGYSVIDFQVPTADGGHDKIDLILQNGSIIYITEVKKFKSNESFLRCALEITTYRKKLNEKFFEEYGCNEETLKKAVLIDKDSFAYQQLELPWARKLKEDITVLELSNDGKAFHITEKK